MAGGWGKTIFEITDEKGKRVGYWDSARNMFIGLGGVKYNNAIQRAIEKAVGSNRAERAIVRKIRRDRDIFGDKTESLVNALKKQEQEWSKAQYKRERSRTYDENGNLIEYEDITPDGYCAELEARKKYPNYEIGKVYTTQVDLNVRTKPDVNSRQKLYKELKTYVKLLDDDSVMPKVKLEEAIEMIEEEQEKIAMMHAQAQMMQQRAQQFLMEDPEAQASQVLEAEQQIPTEEAPVEGEEEVVEDNPDDN